MKKRFIEENKTNLKTILVMAGIIVILLFAMLILNIISSKLNTNLLSYDNLTTIKEVIEYYKSTYISEKESKDKNYHLDVNVILAKMPYDENNNSNEEYYNNLLEDSAKVLRYNSFRFFDEKNNITIEVICDGRKIVKILINGIEDYFIYMESELSMGKFKEIPNTNFEIESEVLNRCIEENWKSNIFLGEKESICDKYTIYFDEGYKVKYIDGKIYNLVFTNKYKEKVVSNINVDFSNDDIKDLLGTPTFENKELNLIGYKNEQVYIFFSEGEISVYRIDDKEANEFFKLADKYIDEELDFLDFMNQLTYLWPDYNEYEYDKNSMFISYPLKGIEIKLNYNDELNGIYIYNNINCGKTMIQNYIKNTDFVARLQSDSVFLAESRRIINKNNIQKKSEEYLNTLEEDFKEKINKKMDYILVPELDSNNYIYSMKFYSRFGDAPDRELSDSIDSFVWGPNNTFIYSKSKKGIYMYNLDTGNVSRILFGEDNEYKLEDYSDGKLKFDDTQIDL